MLHGVAGRECRARRSVLYQASLAVLIQRFVSACSLLLFLVLFSVVGCSNNVERYAVEGEVKLASGDSLEAGLITWIPDSQSVQRKISADIKNGVYEITKENGLAAGSYRVEVFAVPAAIQAIAEGNNPHSMQEGQADFREIAVRFNLESTLVGEIKEQEINKLDFEVAYSE